MLQAFCFIKLNINIQTKSLYNMSNHVIINYTNETDVKITKNVEITNKTIYVQIRHT